MGTDEDIMMIDIVINERSLSMFIRFVEMLLLILKEKSDILVMKVSSTD